MQGQTAVFTIVAKNYLPQARVLMQSAAENHPEWQRFVILADGVDGYFDPQTENFETVLSSSLPVSESLWFHFKYTILELCTALKPYAFEYLFDQGAFDRIVYLDPDIAIYSPLSKITEALASANIVLTPHLTSSLDDDKRPGEIDVLRSGAYNLGFIGLARSRETKRFLAWWRQRLFDHCIVDLARGLFVDQKWIDLVPGMFEGVFILRDAGYNVAYWNLSHRVVSHSETGYEVSGSPLAFFHFSGYDPDQPSMLSRHQNRFKMQDLPPATRQLLVTYSQRLVAAGYPICRNWPYAYACFKNGIRIPDVGRPIHHEAPDLVKAIDDPFSDQGFTAFLEVWNSPVQELPGDEQRERPGISRLAYRIYRTRTDLQSAMPDIFGGHYKRFLEWVLVSGRVEHGLGKVFLTTISDAIRANKNQPDALRRPMLPPDAFNNTSIASTDGGSKLGLTTLAKAIYESRPELQLYFPDPFGRDGLRFLLWLLTYGKNEHNLSRRHIVPLEEQWRVAVGTLPRWSSRLRYELILRGMAASVYLRSILARLPLWRARLWRIRRKPRVAATSLVRGRSASSEPVPGEFGVNLVGYFDRGTGMGQSVRAAQSALRAAAVPTSVRSCGGGRDAKAAPMSMASPYSTNLIYVNADQTDAVRRDLGEEFYSNRHNIANWVWELEQFPDRWHGAFAPYQEIWTPSTFCRNAVSQKATIPVFCIPHAIAPVVPPGLGRQYFGLAPDVFTFLFAFDVLSVMERKNPLAVIRAFNMAFPANSRCQLVLKVNNAAAKPRDVETLRGACSSAAIRIIESNFSREEMNALTQCADCIVSLHRSEGFGLLIAEAMYLGKPVIVTNYSGNTDFTRPNNSLLVDYSLIRVGRNCEPYDPASLWADPNLEEAASHMRKVADSAVLRTRLSNAGRAFVRAALSPKAVGLSMRQRLDALGRADPRTLEASAAPDTY